MTGLGTLVNVGAILVGTTVGLLLKGGLPKRLHDTILNCIGLAIMFIGISGTLAGMLVVEDGMISTRYVMTMIISLIIGGMAGEAVNIEYRLELMGEWCKSKIPVKGDKMATFVEAFVSSSLLFCVGAMAIVGALEDGLSHNYSTLFAKAIMDGVISVVFAASLGFGVYFSAASILIYQGSITLLAGVVKPFLTDLVITQMSMVGSVLIFALGINMIFGKKISTGNLLPAMFLPMLFQLLHF